MDLFVVLARPGFRVAQRKHKRAPIGVQHRITKKDAQDWFLGKFQDARISK